MAESRYTKVRKIAVGGMAEVWKAKSQGAAGFEKTVAIKMVLPALAQDPEFVRRFIREAKVAAELVHPNIVQVFDFGELEKDVYFIAMEYVPGLDLHSLNARMYEDDQRIPVEIALYAGIETAKALGYAHSRQPSIIHRDISPHNLLVSFEGEVKVADFGIAKVTGSSTVAGTVKGKIGYLSPEQAFGRKLDKRSDLFSLGVTLYKLVTGRDLFPGETMGERYSKVASFDGLSQEAAKPLPPATLPILKRLLHVKPEDRYQDATELEADLLGCLDVQAMIPARQALAALVRKYDRIGFDQEQSESSKPVVTGTQPTLAVITEAPDGSQIGENRQQGAVPQDVADENAPTKSKSAPRPRKRARPKIEVPAPAPAPPKRSGQVVATVVTVVALTVLFVAAGILAQQFVPGWQFLGKSTTSPVGTTVAAATSAQPSATPEETASPEGTAGGVVATPAATETPTPTASGAPIANPTTPRRDPTRRQTRKPTRTRVANTATPTATAEPTETKRKIVRKIPRYDVRFLTGCTTEQLAGVEKEVRGAIRKGVPLFNSGDTAQCFEIYRDAAQAVRVLTPRSCSGPRTALQGGLDRASGLETSTEKAWAMRDAFDGLLRVIEKKKKQPN